MKPARIALGEKIRSLRDGLGFTQEQLAERVDISVKHMGQIERGIANPTFNTLLGLAESLGTTLPDLLDFQRYRLSEGEMRATIIQAMDVMNTDQLRALKIFCEAVGVRR